MEEVLRYGEAFWRQGPKTFSEEAWKRIKARVEIKEKRLNEVKLKIVFSFVVSLDS